MDDIDDGQHRRALVLREKAYLLADQLVAILALEDDGVLHQQAIEILMAGHAHRLSGTPDETRFFIDSMAKHAKQILGVWK